MLSDRANQVLDLEERMPRLTGLKYDRIYAMSDNPAKYFQELNRIIDDPEALAERPMLVKRLLRARDRRVAVRASRRFDTAG